MTEPKPVKKHIKMYTDDEWLEVIKEHAKKEGLTQSNYLFSAVKKDLKRNKKS